jgi:uncharacterized protein (DUF952 family)
MRPTFHLVAVDVWAASDPQRPYEAPSLGVEGFIHCTDGMAEMVATANRHYRDDQRPFAILTIDLEAAGSPWRVDEPAGIYPHVFGPIDRQAILRSVAAPRSSDGEFLPFDA